MPSSAHASATHDLSETLDGSSSPDLRGRRRQATLRDIGAAALELFEERGVAATTVDDIAKLAGVSPRTFFRYFATKEESVLVIHENFDKALADRLVGLDPHRLLQCLEEAHEDVIMALMANETESNRWLRIRRLMCHEPALRSAAFALDCQAYGNLLELLLSSLPAETDPMVARIAIEAAGATMRIACDEWATRREAGEDADLLVVYNQARSLLRSAASTS